MYHQCDLLAFVCRSGRALPSPPQVLEKIAETEFEMARISNIPRRNWNALRGLNYVRHYAHRSQVSALETDVSSKYLCLSALAALIEAVEQEEGTSFIKGTLKITYSTVQGIMLLDPATVQNLEILQNLRTGDTKASLFGVPLTSTPVHTARLARECRRPLRRTPGQSNLPSLPACSTRSQAPSTCARLQPVRASCARL